MNSHEETLLAGVSQERMEDSFAKLTRDECKLAFLEAFRRSAQNSKALKIPHIKGHVSVELAKWRSSLVNKFGFAEKSCLDGTFSYRSTIHQPVASWVVTLIISYKFVEEEQCLIHHVALHGSDLSGTTFSYSGNVEDMLQRVSRHAYVVARKHELAAMSKFGI